MILYENNIENFNQAMKGRNLINFMANEYYSRASRKISPITNNSWKYTLEVLRQLLSDAHVNGSCGIRIDYVMLDTGNRFEIIITGEKSGEAIVHVVELLPWEKIRCTDELDIVSYDDVELQDQHCVHPSYQSISYKHFLPKGFSGISISSYVYLFECNRDSDSLRIIDSYPSLTREAPVFFAEDDELVSEKLSVFKDCDNGKTILNLFHERDQLSSDGVDAFLSGMLTDDEMNFLSEDQKLIMATTIKRCTDQTPSLLVVDGAPGTGKTMLAVSCISELGKLNKKVAYLSTTRVQCDMLHRKLEEKSDKEFEIDVIPRFRIKHHKNPQHYDAIFIDESQLLTAYNSENESVSSILKTILDSATVVVFLYSSSQTVSGNALKENDLITLASNYTKEYKKYKLNQNMRYAGNGSGISWLAHQFQIENTVYYEDWNSDSFEIKIAENPSELFEMIKAKSSEGKLSRVLVRYRRRSELSYDAVTGEEVYTIPEYNSTIPVCTIASSKIRDWYKDDTLINYAAGPQVIQGLEFNYAGVIIGKELSYDTDSGEIVVSTNIEEFAQDEIQFIKNSYYMLITRGINGVFLFIEDPALRNYLTERLQYSARRFTWIKDLETKYHSSAEAILLQNEERKNSYSYVHQVYKAVNDFIKELKVYSENQLDEESFKVISDKCSNLLLELQSDPMSQSEIQDRYRTIILKNMGESAWKKLSETGQKCLISSELTYHDMKDYNQLYDFSAVCVQVSKAVEYELTKRFYVSYVEYLKEAYDQINDPDNFISKLPEAIKKEERRRTRLLKEQEVMLGTIPYIVGINLDGVITDQQAFDEFEKYAQNALLVSSNDVKKTLAKHLKFIVRIKNDYRNKAAHKNPMDVVSAKACLDYVIEVQRTLGQMLDDYNF